MESHVLDISHVIQLAVAPVFLLTAIATLINAMNTRLGRIVDRRRLVVGQLWQSDDSPSRGSDATLRRLAQSSSGALPLQNSPVSKVEGDRIS